MVPVGRSVLMVMVIFVEIVKSVENVNQTDQQTNIGGDYERHRAKVCAVCVVHDEIILGIDKCARLNLSRSKCTDQG